MKVIKKLDTTDILDISEKIKFRQDLYDEDLGMSIGVVLMNLGDPYVDVECIGGEWSGRKGDLPMKSILPSGIPLCPLKHPLIETTRAPVLALIEED